MSDPVDIATLGDHPVLNFLNTLPVVDGELTDMLRTDGDVIERLRMIGLLSEDARPQEGLLALARKMRESIRRAVERRKEGKTIAVEELNAWLAESWSWLELSATRGRVAIRRRRQTKTNVEILGPLVEAAAELLAEGDFELVRQCEDEACVLWFYDRTRSHRRRWCSAATCGNRNKVREFRERQRG